MMRALLATVIVLYFIGRADCVRHPKKYNETKPPAKYDNPNYIRDRIKTIINKPFWNETWQNRFHKQFHPAWMDYCDPYHCNDYHKPACGLNRKRMRFRWFQSGCHIAMNNYCATYRGNIKYDMIHAKYCIHYAIFLRMGCPNSCDAEDLEPVCGVSGMDNHVVLFRSRCALDAANCRLGIFQEYEEVDMNLCAYHF
ncbi:uncharacterized protein [Battus philenor]|uniref:uncharacterized protein n=1 Tax=Battus philenor TaxID=42288 RepID=UPI0035CF7B0A